MWTRRGFGLAAGAIGATTALGVRAQEPLTPSDRFLQEGRYLPQYMDLKARAAAGDPAAGGMLEQYASFLGDEATALADTEKPPHPNLQRPDLDDAESRDAMEAILEGAARTSIVILNEAHNISGHRNFAGQVARALRPLGYDWFAAETFTQRQQEPAPSITLYRQGMPFIADFGWYSRDPVYAEAVREAARLGYRFASYEQMFDQQAPEGADWEGEIAAREEAQADNLIANILSGNPGAKVFVYVGYAHAMEKPGVGGTWFAARLKAKTGIDPLTIEQSFNWPALNPAHDAPHVAAVLERFAPTAPVVVWKDGATIGARTHAGQMDLSVFHPRRAPVSGRPGWLAADPLRKPVEVMVPPFTGLTLLQAMRLAEGTAGVPADHFLLTEGQDRATLLLPPGGYGLRLETEAGIQPMWGTINVA
ncbi:hypothetical protein [Brevundimonas sp.]|uniref:hypothetical protein n=1 Tax=Brevundimonas sp. TaxID=1871086 RepID=UPI003F6FD4EB